jgi:hypothetical protein
VNLRSLSAARSGNVGFRRDTASGKPSPLCSTFAPQILMEVKKTYALPLPRTAILTLSSILTDFAMPSLEKSSL